MKAPVNFTKRKVLAESEIVATETKGNSDESAKSKINMPRKEVTPDSPVLKRMKNASMLKLHQKVNQQN